jgi:hypothetical protein
VWEKRRKDGLGRSCLLRQGGASSQLQSRRDVLASARLCSRPHLQSALAAELHQNRLGPAPEPALRIIADVQA